MEIVEKKKDKKEEKWQLGDVLKTNVGNIALIVKDNNLQYCLIDITPGHSFYEVYCTKSDVIFGDSYTTINELYHHLYDIWHKANAKLVIE